MNLNDISANIRLRNPWEAMDLGFAMVKKWWKSIYLPLIIVTLPIAALFYVITPEDKLWIAGLLFWWFKPLYDRIVLFIISQQLFGQKQSTWSVLGNIPNLIWNTGFFQTMTFRRLSLSRGFNLPIWQLEQLRGSDRSQRQSVLHQISHTHAAWLTIVLFHIEIFMVFALFGLLMMLLPDKMASDFFVGLFSNKVDHSIWIDRLNYLFSIFIITFIAPFYIASNFALYINRRTQLEAWDIELDFRKISQRIKRLPQFNNAISSLLICCVWVGMFHTEAIYAETKEDKVPVTEFLEEQRKPASESKKVIKETLLTKNLNDKQTIFYWVKKKTPKVDKKRNTSFAELLEPFAKIVGFIIEFGLWILLGIGLLILFYFRDRWLYLLRIKKKEKQDDYESPDIMFGMDVRPESLPKDIIAEVRKLWQENNQRDAMSLLYRGALARLLNNENIKLENSDTEGDVLRNVKKNLNKEKSSFMTQLTTFWKLVAYAHRFPKTEEVENLLNRWHKDFVIDTKKEPNV